MEMKRFLSWSMKVVMAAMVVLGTSALTSCGNDHEIEETLEDAKDELEVKFSVGELQENEDGSCTLSASGIEIHYAGKIAYEAGFAISTTQEFNAEYGGHFVVTSRTHSASNHASSTSCGWGSFRVNFPEEFPKKVYYTIFIRTDDGKYIYGPAKSFERTK